MSSSALEASQQRRRSLVLPPARPSPTAPIPPTPDASGPLNNSTTWRPSSASNSPRSASPVTTTLGPSGTIRAGRPRGATISSVPSTTATPHSISSYDAAHHRRDVRSSSMARPRSLLSNEVTADDDRQDRHLYEVMATDESTMQHSFSSSMPAHKNLRSSVILHSNDTSYQSSLTPSAYSLDKPVRRGSSLVPNSSNAATEEVMSAPPMTSAPSSSAASIASSSAVASSSKDNTETRSRSGSGTGLLHLIQSRPRSQANFVIAVVGHKNAGKSTVIRKGLRQFGLSRPTNLSDHITSHSTVCIVDQEQRTIEVLEMDASVLLNGPARRFAWPRSLPYIDAAILCYDASQIASFRGMSELLENLAMNHLSTVMLACKSEISPKAVDPYYASDMASVYNVGLAECSVQSEEGKKRMRDCFSYLVKEVAKNRASMRQSGDQASPVSATLRNGHSNMDRTASQLNDLTISKEALLNGSSSRYDGAERRPSAISMDQSEGTRSSNGSRRPARNTNRNLSDATIGSQDGGGSEDEGHVQQSINRAQLGLQSAKSAGGYISIEELWDKFFFAAVSGNDERFLHMFMTFYRGFARPIELLNQIIARFDSLSRGEKSDGVMIRYSLMKLTTMLGDWMQEYPGDLSSDETFARLEIFFNRLLQHPATMHVAAPMQPLLNVVRNAPDLDAAWSKDQDNDKPRSVAADVPPVKPIELHDRSASNSSSGHATHLSPTFSDEALRAPLGDEEDGDHNLIDSEQRRNRSASDATESSEGHHSSNASVQVNASSTLPTTPIESNGTGKSSHHIFSTRSSSAPAPNQKQTLRIMSNALFDIREEDIAQELSRLEWDLFCTVGPRDLLRHILVSRKSRSPDSPVARSIAQFNYVSAWVASLVLVQAKTKQRARMLEKFMEIASILRKTNNYNTLHAILAGLGNAAIHRLKHTRELLIGKPVMKQYQSLTRLMGSERSFAAYRLALENSEGRTIPYLGVHLQDILSTSDGNPSKRASDGMIHWRKFSLMYDAVMAIVRCQQYQIPLPENTALSHMVFGLPVMDEDTMYRRSLHVEPRQTTSGSHSTAAAGSHIIKQIFSIDS